MSSPEPWLDARARLTAALSSLGATAAWPNEPNEKPAPGQPWLAVEITADVADPIELGGATWREDGTLLVHVMAPLGAGLTPGLTLRKAVANLFRGLAPGAVTWRGMSFYPGEDAGPVHRLTLGIRYSFTDH